MQRHLSYYIFSLTMDMNPVSRNPRVRAAQPFSGGSGSLNAPEVRVYYFYTSSCLPIPFCLQSMATLIEGDHWQMWEFIRI